MPEKGLESGEMADGYGNVTSGDRGHDGGQVWSQKFGLGKGKLYRVMVGDVRLMTGRKETKTLLKRFELPARSHKEDLSEGKLFG